MAQSGDDDLWPRVDGDEPADGGATQKLPTPGWPTAEEWGSWGVGSLVEGGPSEDEADDPDEPTVRAMRPVDPPTDDAPADAAEDEAPDPEPEAADPEPVEEVLGEPDSADSEVEEPDSATPAPADDEAGEPESTTPEVAEDEIAEPAEGATEEVEPAASDVADDDVADEADEDVTDAYPVATEFVESEPADDESAAHDVQPADSEPASGAVDDELMEPEVVDDEPAEPELADDEAGEPAPAETEAAPELAVDEVTAAEPEPDTADEFDSALPETAEAASAPTTDDQEATEPSPEYEPVAAADEQADTGSEAWSSEQDSETEEPETVAEPRAVEAEPGDADEPSTFELGDVEESAADEPDADHASTSSGAAWSPEAAAAEGVVEEPLADDEQSESGGHAWSFEAAAREGAVEEPLADDERPDTGGEAWSSEVAPSEGVVEESSVADDEQPGTGGHAWSFEPRSADSAAAEPAGDEPDAGETSWRGPAERTAEAAPVESPGRNWLFEPRETRWSPEPEVESSPGGRSLFEPVVPAEPAEPITDPPDTTARSWLQELSEREPIAPERAPNWTFDDRGPAADWPTITTGPEQPQIRPDDAPADHTVPDDTDPVPDTDADSSTDTEWPVDTEPPAEPAPSTTASAAETARTDQRVWPVQHETTPDDTEQQDVGPARDEPSDQPEPLAAAVAPPTETAPPADTDPSAETAPDEDGPGRDAADDQPTSVTEPAPSDAGSTGSAWSSSETTWVEAWRGRDAPDDQPSADAEPEAESSAQTDWVDRPAPWPVADAADDRSTSVTDAAPPDAGSSDTGRVERSDAWPGRDASGDRSSAESGWVDQSEPWPDRDAADDQSTSATDVESADAGSAGSSSETARSAAWPDRDAPDDQTSADAAPAAAESSAEPDWASRREAWAGWDAFGDQPTSDVGSLAETGSDEWPGRDAVGDQTTSVADAESSAATRWVERQDVRPSWDASDDEPRSVADTSPPEDAGPATETARVDRRAAWPGRDDSDDRPSPPADAELTAETARVERPSPPADAESSAETARVDRRAAWPGPDTAGDGPPADAGPSARTAARDVRPTPDEQQNRPAARDTPVAWPKRDEPPTTSRRGGPPDTRRTGPPPPGGVARSDAPARRDDRPAPGRPTGPPPRRNGGPPPEPPMSGSLTTVMPPVGVPPRRPEPMRQPPGGLDRPGRPPAPPRREPWPPPEPPRTGPRRVGPPPPPRDEPELKSESEWVDEPAAASDAPRRKRPVLFALLAILLVVGVGTGVVFAVPGLRDSLGLAGDDAAAVVPPAAPIAFTPGLRGPDPQAAAPTPEGVRAALEGPAGNPGLGALTGVVLDPATGTVLWESGPTEPRTPASNTKLLTAAAALLTLDHTEQLTTKVVEGDQPGSVVIVGGGDPTLSSLDPGVDSVYPGAAHLSDLVDQVKASGVQVTSVTVDLGRYTGGGTASGWGPDDIDNGYITPIVPAMLDGGRSNPQEADPPRASNPARDLVEEFAERVGAEVPASAAGTAPQGARVLGEVHSAPLTELVDNMLRMSDNVLGEIVAHEVAKATGGEATFEGGSKATLDVLRQNGFDVSGVELSDGSGLSTQNLVPAALLGQILSVAAGPDGDDPRTVKLRPLLGGLPVAGGTGTLADRFGEAGATDGKGWVRAKTGTLSGVNSLAGLVLDVDGRPLVFAFMTTGTESAAARPALDEIVAPLRQCGCR